MDKNLPKLLSKDIVILQNIVSDVFPNIPSSAMKTKDNILETIDERLDKRNLYRGDEFIQNIFYIYEALESRHGIMIVGRPTSGKSTSIRMLQDVLHQLYLKEYNQKSNHFLRVKAQKLGIPIKVVRERVVPKDSDPILDYHLSISEEERALILATCNHKDISNFALNPKSITMSQLMGFFDETSREWTDGVLSHAIRNASNDTTGKRMLITCDGPIEPDWVENMNSVLDDNKRLSLVTGETLYLTPNMNILLETSELENCPPATISRCAIIYIRRETLPPKSQFNHWLWTLPKILRDQQERLDLLANYFITDIFEHLLKPDKMLYNVSHAWAIMTFIRIFDSLIFEYRNEKYNDARSLRKVQIKMRNEETDILEKVKA